MRDLVAKYDLNRRRAPWSLPADPRWHTKRGRIMGLFDQLGLDPNVDRNSFTKEDAAKVFEKAIERLRSADDTADVVESIVDSAFDVLKIIALLA